MNAAEPLRLAVVDDSSFVRKAVCRVFENDPRVVIAGTAGSGEELLANLDAWQPTAATLDLSMPGMGGLATLDRILQWRAIPVVILSTQTSKEAPLTIEALSRGAVDFIDKEQFSLVDFEALRGVLVEKLLTSHPVIAGRCEAAALPVAVSFESLGGYEAVLIGASTGGPPAIEGILGQLGGIDVPIGIVQHMPAGFTTAFAERLNSRLPLRVCEAAHGGSFDRGVAYIAPAGMHLRIKRDGDRLITVLGSQPETAPHRPSVDVLFSSAATMGLRTVSVLLTGMGEDGARGLLALVCAGSMTLAQDESTSVVYGMPRAAAQLNAVREQLPLPRIARRIRELLAGSQNPMSAVELTARA
jgi:two-component system, chemotaxis family, protein-glutamate methylesterase/glutaminase